MHYWYGPGLTGLGEWHEWAPDYFPLDDVVRDIQRAAAAASDEPYVPRPSPGETAEAPDGNCPECGAEPWPADTKVALYTPGANCDPSSPETHCGASDCTDHGCQEEGAASPREGRDTDASPADYGPPSCAIPPGRWRVGSHAPRNLWVGGAYPEGVDVGRMDTPELAAYVVEAVNALQAAEPRELTRDEARSIRDRPLPPALADAGLDALRDHVRYLEWLRERRSTGITRDELLATRKERDEAVDWLRAVLDLAPPDDPITHEAREFLSAFGREVPRDADPPPPGLAERLLSRMTVTDALPEGVAMVIGPDASFRLAADAAEARRERDEARAEVERLREALRRVADLVPPSGNLGMDFFGHGETTVVPNVGDIAREALAPADAPWPPPVRCLTCREVIKDGRCPNGCKR